FDRELAVGESFTEFGAEAEDTPRNLMGREENVGELTGRGSSRLDRADFRRVEAGARSRNLVREVHGPAFAHEVFVPAHASIGSGLPGFATEAASVNHYDGQVQISVQRRLILHVHLVDGDVAGRTKSSSGPGSGGRTRGLLFAADEEAALLGE